MPNRSLVVLSLSLTMLLTGCTEKTVDASSDAAMKASVEAIKDSLSEERRQAFTDALELIVKSTASQYNLFQLAANKEQVLADLKQVVGGKTADEIIAEGDRLLAERRARERQQAATEIHEVKARIAEIKADKTQRELDQFELAKFEVVRSRFEYHREEYSYMSKPLIEVTVKNGTRHPVSRAYFEGTLASPNRTIPCVQETFNYSIPGGIEPGESTTWRLLPNQFGEWSHAPHDRDDMVLTVTTYRLDGADDKPLFDARFTEEIQMELESLEERLVALEKVLGQ